MTRKSHCAPSSHITIGTMAARKAERVGMKATAPPPSAASSTARSLASQGQGGGLSAMKSRARIVSMTLAMRSVPGSGVVPNGSTSLSACR